MIYSFPPNQQNNTLIDVYSEMINGKRFVVFACGKDVWKVMTNKRVTKDIARLAFYGFKNMVCCRLRTEEVTQSDTGATTKI